MISRLPRQAPAGQHARLYGLPAPWLLAVVFAVSTRAAAQGAPPALSRFAEHKAETLLRESLPCLGCHRLNGDGGMIGPDLTTVTARRNAAYIAAIVTDPERTLPGTPMPRTAMSEATRALIIRYLTSRPAPLAAPDAGTAPPTTAPLPARDAAALYATYCAACHGARGGGDGANARYLPVKPAVHASREAMSKRSDDALFDTIFGGGAIMNRSPRMPAFGATLSREDIRSLVRYIRTLCGCRGPAWAGDPR